MARANGILSNKYYAAEQRNQHVLALELLRLSIYTSSK